MPKFKRSYRVADLMQQETSDIISKLKDPRIGFVTVTGVDMTDDLRYAKIYVSIMGNEKEVKKTISGLESSKGFVRNEIAKRIKIKFVPEISFIIDKSLEYGDHIEKLIQKIHNEDSIDTEKNDDESIKSDSRGT